MDEYLASSHKPGCEYADGVLYPKTMPTRKHALLQWLLAALIARDAAFEPGTELTVRIGPSRFLIPDIAVQRRDALQDPYPTAPIHLCVEILSPEDSFSTVLAKCREYHGWGVETAWILDPEGRMAWVSRTGGTLQEVPPGGLLIAGELTVSVDEAFERLH